MSEDMNRYRLVDMVLIDNKVIMNIRNRRNQEKDYIELNLLFIVILFFYLLSPWSLQQFLVEQHQYLIHCLISIQKSKIRFNSCNITKSNNPSP